MLELRDYPLGVLENLIGTKGKQATDRKLNAYGYGYTSAGNGKKRVYTLTALPDAFNQFRSYCVFSLGLSTQTDFVKFRDFVFYLENDMDFRGMSDEMMEEYLRMEKHGMSRQTIGKYRRLLEDLGYLAPVGDFVYYRVYKDYGVQKHEVITAEEYKMAWGYYFDWRAAHPDEDSRPAYSHMYSKFKGVPRKQRKIEDNAIYAKELNTLYELTTNSIMEEING